MRIRRATAKDARRISYLIDNTARKVTENNNDEEQLATWKKYNSPARIKRQLKDRVIWCAFEGNRLLGTIALQGDEILGFNVSYSQRGKGIGNELLEHLEEYARKKGLRQLTLTSTPTAFGFYRKRGYKCKGMETVTIWGTDYYERRMVKRL